MNTEKYWQKGQTIIETALLMILLLMFFFGIAEIARAWWLKNQLNNAARVGVRAAVVDDTLTLTGVPENSCQWAGTICQSSSASKALQKACSSITNVDLCKTAKVKVDVTDSDTNNLINASDEVKVTVRGDFNSVVPNLLAGVPGHSGTGGYSLMKPSMTLNSTSIMRFE